MIETEYTIWDDKGKRLKTDSPSVAQAHTNIGFTVTAVTREA